MTRRAECRRAPERLADTLPLVLAQVRDCGPSLGSRAVFRCDWCETEHLHRPGNGARCAHCTIPDSGYPWTGYTLLMDGREGEHPSPTWPAAHQGQRRLRTTAAALARRLRRTVLDALLGQPLGGSRGSVSINGHQVWVSDADLWCVAPEAVGEGKSAEVRGHGLSGLAAVLYGVSRGVAAARLLQAVTGDVYDPKALAEISAAVDGWAARGTPGRGTPA